MTSAHLLGELVTAQAATAPDTVAVHMKKGERLTFGTAIERSPVVGNPDQIAFASIVENVDIWRLPLDPTTGSASGGLERVTDDAAADRLQNVSADGRVVAFTSSRTKPEQVWLKDMQTGRERQITHPEALPSGVQLAQ